MIIIFKDPKNQYRSTTMRKYESTLHLLLDLEDIEHMIVTQNVTTWTEAATTTQQERKDKAIKAFLGETK